MIIPGLMNTMKDEINTIASDYISEHYLEIVRSTRMNNLVPEDVAGDIVNDVYMSIVKGEQNGDGYDASKGSGDIITVEQFVYARIKGYAKNKKYRTDDVEISANSDWDESEGKDKISLAQFKYAVATSYDEIVAVDDKLSIEDNLEYLMSFNDVINVKALLKSMINLSSGKYDLSVLAQFREFVAKHEDFGESLREVIKVASNTPALYERVVQAL